MAELIAEPIDDANEPGISPEKLPFAGLLPRLGAFIGDCAVLYFGAKLLDGVTRPALLSLNPALPWLGQLLAFLYFWIGNGPLTGGRTPGKMLMQLQVVGPGGLPIAWDAALRRALIEQCVFFVAVNPDFFAIIFPSNLRFAISVTLALLAVVALAMGIALALSIAMHPRKRGWHDLWAGSYVTRTPLPANFIPIVNGEPDPLTRQRMKMNLRWTLAFWLIAAITLLLQPVKTYFQSEYRQGFQEIARIQKSIPFAPYTLIHTDFPSTETREEFLRTVGMGRERARIKGEAVPTTESLRSRFVIDGEGIYSQFFRKSGTFSPADLADPEFRASMEQLRRDLWNEWRERKLPASAVNSTTSTVQARHYDALLFEPMQLLLYNNTVLRAKIHGPADPAQGGLIYEEFTPSQAPKADTTETTSSMPAAGQPHEPIKP